MEKKELVTTLKRNATKIISNLQREQKSVLITQHGLPAAYLVDVETYEALHARIEVLKRDRPRRKWRSAISLAGAHPPAGQKENEPVAEIVWTEPALAELDAIADYIALDKPSAAKNFVQRVFSSVEQLAEFPKSGSRVPELPKSIHRQLTVSPCRVFYRTEPGRILIIFVMRGERQLNKEFLNET